MASLDISHLEKRNLGLFLNFKSVKCPESGKEKNREVRNPDNENSRTTGTGRDVRLSPKMRKDNLPIQNTFPNIKLVEFRFE
jgi:hypothetical protein